MSELNLDAIEARAHAALTSPTGQQYDAAVILATDVPALVAEVRSLRTMRDAAWQHYDEQVDSLIRERDDAQSLAAVAREKERAALEERDEALRHLTHAAAVEAALTSDLLAAHVEVEQLRVTRATDRNRLRHTRKALAKTRLLLEIRAEQTERLRALVNAKQSWIDGAKVDCDGYDEARAATARVRALCAGADDSEYTTVFAAAVLAALDARDDPSATTTIPIDVAREHAWLANHALEMLVDTGDGTYHPIADALAKVRDLLDPQPPTLREQVAQAWCAEFYGEFSRSAQQPAPDQLDAADAVLAVVADWLAEQPHTTDSWAEMYGEQKAQRDHDVRLLRGES